MASSNGHGGRRPGAGGVRIDLDRPARVVDGETQSVHDVIVSTYARLGFDVDAAARVGVSVETLRLWLRTGAQVSQELLDGRRGMSSLERHEIQYVRLSRACAEAEAEARTTALDLVQRLGAGGLTVEHVTVEYQTDAEGQEVPVKRTLRTETLAPDAATLRWWLSHRVPELRQVATVEHTGEGGGPIRLETSGALDQLAALLDNGGELEPSTNGHDG